MLLIVSNPNSDRCNLKSKARSYDMSHRLISTNAISQAIDQTYDINPETSLKQAKKK